MSLFSSLLLRNSPKKIVQHLTDIAKSILDDDAKLNQLSKFEKDTILKYIKDLSNSKVYYEQANLTFVRSIYPLILAKQTTSGTQNLYSEVLRISSSLISRRLGAEIMFEKGLNLKK